MKEDRLTVDLALVSLSMYEGEPRGGGRLVHDFPENSSY